MNAERAWFAAAPLQWRGTGTVRILLLSIALLAVASCMSPQVPAPGAEVTPPAMLPTYPPVALVPSPPPPVALTPPPTQVASLPPLLGPWTPEPSPGRLTLSNFSFDSAHVVAVVTTSPDCSAPAEGDAQSDFRLPLNGTRIITARPGADVCWRRQLEPDETPNAKGDGWTGWNRAFLSSAITVTSQL